jgi:uncharacterized membrane protein
MAVANQNTPTGRFSAGQITLLVAGLLLLISFFLPWANTGAGNPSGLAVAQSSGALAPLGTERVGLGVWLYLVPLAGLVVAGLAFVRRPFSGPVIAGVTLVAFTVATIFLVILSQTPTITGVLTDSDPANDSLLPFIGLGMWLCQIAAFAALVGSFGLIRSTLPPGSALNSRRIVSAGMLGAIAVTLGVTRLGFFPVPNATGNATIMHIPAIIGAALEGPLVGILAGGIFGLFSMLQDTTGLFNNPLVSVVPRLLIGLTAWLTFRSLRRFSIDLAAAAAGVVGTLTNTIAVVGMLIVLGLLPATVIPAILPQALFEVVLAAILTPIVVRAVNLTRSGRTVADETTPREKSYF